jgi:hypothetical protein
MKDKIKTEKILDREFETMSILYSRLQKLCEDNDILKAELEPFANNVLMLTDESSPYQYLVAGFDFLCAVCRCMTKFPEVERQLFQDSLCSHIDYYNYSYFIGFCMLSQSPGLLKFWSDMVKFINAVPLCEIADDDIIGNEYELFDTLMDLDQRTIFRAIDYIKCSSEVNRALKVAIKNYCADDFADIIVNNRLDTSDCCAAVLRSSSLLRTQKMFDILESAIGGNSTTPNQDEEFFSAQRDLLNIPLIPSEDIDFKEVKELTSRLQQGEFSLCGSYWSTTYIRIRMCIGNMLEQFNRMKFAVPDLDLVGELNTIIENNDELRSMATLIESNNGELPDDYIYGNLYIEEFINHYPIVRTLPPELSIKKSPEDYFESSRKVDRGFCERLYQCLTRNNYIEDNESNHYAFMVRFTKDYHSEEQTDKIVWLATSSLLFNFINWFINTDDKSVGKPWEKTKQFFVNRDGQQININGASNNLDSKSKKVRELLKLLNSI